MLLLILIIPQSASRTLTKIIRSDDPCGLDFWQDRIAEVKCTEKVRGSTWTCGDFWNDCVLTTSVTDWNWSMECQLSTQRCSFEFSRSWFMNGPSDGSAVCDGECAYGVSVWFVVVLVLSALNIAFLSGIAGDAHWENWKARKVAQQAVKQTEGSNGNGQGCDWEGIAERRTARKFNIIQLSGSQNFARKLRSDGAQTLEFTSQFFECSNRHSPTPEWHLKKPPLDQCPCGSVPSLKMKT
jgi:hypothetical protein